MAVSAPGHINTRLRVLLLGSRTGRFDLQCAGIPTGSVKSVAWGRGEILIHFTQEENGPETKDVAKVAS